MILIQHNGEVQIVASLDGYEGATVLQDNITLDHEFKKVVGGQLVDDLEGAQAIARERIEQRADEMSANEMRHLRRQIGTALLWNELQRLKLANATGNFTGLTALEKAKQFPTITALVNLSGSGYTAVATAIENRLWDRVRRMALWEAKLLLGHDAVAAAGTVAAKLAAADAVTWTE